MRESETAKVIAMLKVLDPYPPKGSTPEERQTEAMMILEVWHAAIGDLPHAPVMRAAQRWTAAKRRFPAPIDIREMVATETFGLPDSATAWNQVTALTRQRTPDQIPGPRPDIHPVVLVAARQCGGLMAIRMSERPDLTRRAFEEAYAREWDREVLRPDLGIEVERREALAADVSAAITGGAGDE